MTEAITSAAARVTRTLLSHPNRFGLAVESLDEIAVGIVECRWV
jgi:hypothetical protein